MWHRSYADRLQSWHGLRTNSQSLSLVPCLETINGWWMRCPWTSYYLHWDDLGQWPDPWQLLQDNRFCDLARGLGILYTVAMLDRDDFGTVVLAQCDHDNLVLVADGKYVLNWQRDSIVNITPGPVSQHRSIDHIKILEKIH
jgi:hypothetical protein